MHEAYQPVIDDGRGRFPEDLRVKAPRGAKAAIAAAAQLKHTTYAEYVRQALLRSLEADGVMLRRGCVIGLITAPTMHTQKAPTAWPKRRKVRIGPLTTVGEVAAELGRLYRQARRGEVAVADASRLATILSVMRQCLEASELERRIAEMEAAIAAEISGSVVPFRRNAG